MDDASGSFDFDAPAAEQPGEDSPLRETVLDALRMVYDPEIPVNIVELGLIYDLSVSADGQVKVEMTLTTPHCPVAESMPGEVENAIRAVDGVKDAKVEIVWTPPWHPDLMTEEAKLELGML